MQHLPEYILEEILLRLQVVDLLRVKSVCKRWNSVISSTNFIQLHLKKSIDCPSHHRILMPHSHAFKLINYTDVSGEVVIDDLPMPSETEVTFLGTCDGLVSYYDHENNSICVWNPATRVSKCLKTTEPCRAVLAHWFGHEGVDDDEYKLVIGTESMGQEVVKRHIHLIKPYADEDGEWKSTQELNEKYYFSSKIKGWGTLLNGRVHWLAFAVNSYGDVVPVVCAYDLRCQAIVEVPPHGEMALRTTMCVIKGCLSAIQPTYRRANEDFLLQVLMMKEYGVEESWTKFSVSMGIGAPSQDGIFSLSSFLVGVSDRGDLIINIGGSKVVLYSLEENKSMTLMTDAHGPYGRAIVYVESMVFPQVSKKE